MTRIRTAALPLAAIVVALVLVGCNRNDDRTVGQKVDSAIDTAKTKSESAMNTAERKTEQAMAGASAAMGDAAAKIGEKLDDAGITASVNAELAKDPTLSALKINVDTSNGRVVLRGTAPDVKAKERATGLAHGVKGVSSVDNQLEIRG